MSAASAPARAASHVPGPIGVIVSKANAPVRAQVATGDRGRVRAEQPGVREEVRDDLRLAGVVGEPGGLPVVVRAGEEVEQRAVVDRLERGVRLRGAPRRRDARPRSSSARIASARAGSSTAGVRTPSQISALGSCTPVRVAPHERHADRPSGGEPTGVGSRRVRSAPAPRSPPARRSASGSARSTPGRRTRSPTCPASRVGHVTVWRDEPDGRGIARTGVTAILPGPVGGAVRRAGAGRRRGAQRRGRDDRLRRAAEWGAIETPVYLTSTMAVGRIYDGAVAVAVAADPAVGTDDVVIPVVGRVRRQLAPTTPRRAGRGRRRRPRGRRRAGGPVAEGAVGAGTGMVCFGWKGGIGTASRVVPELGATRRRARARELRLAPDLRVDGVPVGRTLVPDEPRPRDGGQLHRGRGDRRAARGRAARAPRAPRRARARPHRLGRAPRQRRDLPRVRDDRAGGPRGAGRRAASVADTDLDDLFAATVDATEEAVLNALWAAPDVTGRGGTTPGAAARPRARAAARGRAARGLA